MTISALKAAMLTGLFFIFTGPGAAYAQEPSRPPEGVPHESDYMYRIHYDEVQEIMKAPLGQRETRLETYMRKLNPKSKILQYMPGFFAQIAEDYRKAGRSPDALLAKMAQLFPEAAAGMEMAAFQQALQSKNYAQAAQLGEKLYAKNPADKQVTALLAQAYIQAGNAAKAREFSEKTLQLLGVKEGVYYGAWLARYHQSQGQTAQAVTYYDQILRAFPSEGPQGWTSQGWKEVLIAAYAVKGSDAYLKQNYEAAATHYEKSLQYDPHNDAAYLALGLSYWKQQKLDFAIDAFAKGTVLNKSSSAKARQYLEQLYKARNNDSLEGLDKLLGAARQALGIG